jgi:uncharacterized membrane protein
VGVAAAVVLVGAAVGFAVGTGGVFIGCAVAKTAQPNTTITQRVTLVKPGNFMERWSIKRSELGSL